MKRITKICLTSTLIVLFLVSTIIVVINLVGVHKEQTIEDVLPIEDILQINFDDISYVKTGGAHYQDEDYSVSEFTSEYGHIKVEKFLGGTGSTAHQYFVAYDSNNQILFTIVDIGNRDLLYISKGTFNINDDNSDKLYRMVE